MNTEAGDPVAATEALKGFDVPEGFEVSLFASEPHVQQPISITTDERGRLWIAENYTYAEAETNFDEQEYDRIVILEDTDNDGKFDQRKVYWDGAQKLTSVEVGHGGVWALCAPNLLFIPDRDKDDVPDGDPQVVLDGWDENVVRHNIVNGLKWGPDGWLYGRHGILATSLVGKPGDTPSQRKQINCGIWRYHPTSDQFEIVAHGTTNPWGFDYDDHGQMFFINTVIGHLWHVVPGAHYRRMFGGDLNPYTYELIEQCADHFHWDTGETWNEVQKGISYTTLEAGGGHAHSGLMIYLGDNWPESYRNSIYTLNFHGRRMNHDFLERKGAGYVGHHGEDLFLAKDPWFRGIDLIYGPDGGVFVTDWSDSGECHDQDGIHRTSGRIYKVTYGKPDPPAFKNLAELTDLELVELQLHKNDWYVRQSRRLLHERAASGKDMSLAVEALKKQFVEESDDTRQLRALWCLNLIDESNQDFLREQFTHPSEHVRLWAVRFLCEPPNVDAETLDQLVKMAKAEESGLVRLFLASTMQRLPAELRWPMAEALVTHGEDSDDSTLPLMIWYGVEGAVPANPERAVRLAEISRIPLVRRLIARRITSDLDSCTAAVNQLLQLTTSRDDTEFQLDLLKGMNQALQGRRQAPMPESWQETSQRLSAESADSVLDEVRKLGVVFGDGLAISELREIALNKEADVESRRSALRTLVAEGGEEVLAVLKLLLSDFALSNEAVRGFASYNDPEIPTLVLGRYEWLDPEGKALAIDTLTSRPAYAQTLLSAVTSGSLDREVISAYHARQLRSFEDESINTELETIWGSLRETSAEKKQQIEKLKSVLTPERMVQSDPSQGRQIFSKTCSACHILYGQGRSVGPDLTGSNRNNLSYLLENIVDPGASVSKDYKVSVIVLDDGRIVNGVVVLQTPHTITVRTQNEELVLDREEIEEILERDASLMPDGVLTQLDEEQICNLFAYLMSRSQIALPDDNNLGQ
ncbi:PVC-type heme-binding CxxCH protein [Bythopirellula goksoeyrii]|uniref:PVC-type heme-binding CxxCH protein n=1 Tax=Bythopirellula goksoeyrii TaxID=1400387 RepID=UPI00143DD5DC|nr:PVC-type heme-binding CxxCH protein [Bythopirellula goksoeyrii]